MQKIATRVFIYASIAFGILGILLVLTAPAPNTPDSQNSDLNTFIMRLLMVNVFIILPSFALSVAGKYLNGKSQ